MTSFERQINTVQYELHEIGKLCEKYVQAKMMDGLLQAGTEEELREDIRSIALSSERIVAALKTARERIQSIVDTEIK